jgi:pimeloyl-ACP methyl ester carboxylesterase
MGRSTRSDGTADQRPDAQADDVHAVIAAVGGGPVDLFASSGGAVTALASGRRGPAAHRVALSAAAPSARWSRR